MKKILVVDDAVFMRHMLKKILSGEGYEICGEATNAKEAVEKYKILKPDLVTMDIVMPMMEELDGIGAVREITKIDPNAKILIISVMTQQSLMVDALQAGAKDVVAKPIKADKVIEAVGNILKK
ncbi:response regulator [Candidatus Omnitrophota bacterium]